MGVESDQTNFPLVSAGTIKGFVSTNGLVSGALPGIPITATDLSSGTVVGSAITGADGPGRQRPGDLLHGGDDVGLQVGQVVGTDANHHVVRAGDVFRRQHTWERGELLGDDLGAAHLGLDQHESLDHPFPLRLAA